MSRDLLGNITPLVHQTVACAQEAGFYGASGFGGGFGGSVFALAPKDTVEGLMTKWQESIMSSLLAYKRESKLDHEPQIFEVRPVSGFCRMFSGS